jgi:hypothetical protein
MADQIVRCPYCVQGNEFRPIRLRDHWKKNGYRSIQKDLQEAFNAIEKDIHSKQVASDGKVFRSTRSIQTLQVPSKRQCSQGRRERWVSNHRSIRRKELDAVSDHRVSKKQYRDAHDNTITQVVEEIIAILNKSEDLF